MEQEQMLDYIYLKIKEFDFPTDDCSQIIDLINEYGMMKFFMHYAMLIEKLETDPENKYERLLEAIQIYFGY